MNQGKKVTMLAALACTAVLCGGYASAAEVPQEFSMDEVVVTANRTKDKVVDTSANVAVVSAEKIAERHYIDVAEALRDVPGANVVHGGVGADDEKIILNGDDRVLILVDGRRVNYDVGMSSGRGSYDLNQLPDVGNIERIEVVKGHGGALYGSDAVGGVVNIITKKVDHSYGKISIGFGSQQAREAKAMYAFKKDKTGVMVSYSKYKQGYFKYKDAASDVTKRWPTDSDYDNEKVSLKITQDLSARSNLEFTYDHSKTEGHVPWAWYATKWSEKKTDNLGLRYNWTLKGGDEGYLQLYRNKYKYESSSTIEETDVGFEAQQAITTGANNKLVVGASYRRAKASNDGRNGAAKYSDSINNKAIFVNDQWEFLPSWTLSAGVRYDKHSTAGGKTTWSAGLNKKLDATSHVYFNWGQVFKAPTLDDLFYDDGYMTGNPDLKPEKGDTWTLGYGAKLGKKTEVNVSYFQSDLDDAIKWASSNTGWHPFNVYKQKKRGFELSVNHKLNENWDLEASYSHVRVRNDYNSGAGYVRDGSYVPNMYRFGVRFHNNKWNVNAFLRGGSGADSTKYVDSSYITMDMSANFKATDNLSFYAKGYNLFNKAYAESSGITGGSYTYPAEGFHFLIGAEFSF